MAPAPAPPEHWAGLEILARGATRLCARDPADPRHCLKFELPPDARPAAGLRARLRRWLGRQLPRFGENATELRAWRRLRRRHGAALDGRFAACVDLVDTRWGRALRCECVLLDDGTPARSLHHWLSRERPASPAPLRAALDAFEAYLLARDIPLFDLNAGNLVVVPGAGGPRLVCVDAKSTVSGKELVPLSRWVPVLRRRKIARRAARLRERLVPPGF